MTEKEKEKERAANNRRLGRFIKKHREKKRETDPSFSVRGLATKIGMSATYLSKIERGEIPASDGAIQELADVLGIDINEIFAQAGKIEPELEKKLVTHKAAEEMSVFLRRASELPESALKFFNKSMESFVPPEDSKKESFNKDDESNNRGE